MTYDFLASYKSFDYSCKLANEAFIHCKYDTYTLLREEKLLLFSYGGKIDPISKLIIDTSRIDNIDIESVNQNFDILKIEYGKDDITIYCHK